MKHGNISVFVPHLGCPHDCVFCNQKHISRVYIPPTVENVKHLLDNAFSVGCNSQTTDMEYEIAFFGGSFTAIDRNYMTALLDAAQPYRDRIVGIRISTRPDCIDTDVLDILASKGVTDIELGVQSMDDRVLMLSGRGHTADDTVRASALIRKYGFGLGHQMMTGLPGDTSNGAICTAERIIALAPDTVRIYPTLVIEDTRLCELYDSDEYIPQTVDEAAQLCAQLICMFEQNGIKVIRVGLHSDIDETSIVAGPYHPAFREIAESKLYFNLICSVIDDASSFTGTVYVAKGELSKAIGQRRENAVKLKDIYGKNCHFEEDGALSPRQIRIK